MEKKFKNLLSGAGRTAKNLVDQAVQAADQNDDGKFDLSDVSAIAGTMGNAVKKGTQVVKESAEDKARQLELKTLQPIFPDSLDSAGFLMPKFIRVVERDKRHAESEVCRGSIGYNSDPKGFRVVNVFRDSVEAFGLMLYPDCDCEFYYVDPSERDRYIALNEYFGYLRKVRVSELQKIAQDLGAKHFKVTFKEEQASFAEKKVRTKAKGSKGVSADAERESEEKKYSRIEIDAEMHFPGKPPIRPQVKYFQRDPNIQNLISMRLDESSPLLNQKLKLEMSASSGMKVSDAAKIDMVLKGLKCEGNTTVESEAKSETRRSLEYEIDF